MTATMAQRRENSYVKDTLPPEILVAEDDAAILRQIQFILERAGYRVATATTGREAIICLMDRRPDLIVADIMMPEMDGFELLDHVRSDDALADLPVMLLTAKNMDEDVKLGYANGADLYLTKPFDPDELLLFVQRMLR